MFKKTLSYSILLALSLVLAACNSAGSLNSPANQTETDPSTPPVEVVGSYTLESYPFYPGANINFGSGFSTPNERFLGVGNCLEFGNTKKTSLEEILQYEPSAFKLDFEMDLATSRAELMDKLDISAGIKARIGVVDLSGSASILFDDETSSNDVYLVAKGKATGHTFGFLALGENHVQISGYNAENPKESTGFADLYLNHYEKFLERCGDRFVSSITLGGEFYLVAQIETYSEEHKNDIAGSLKISISSLGIGGSGSLKKVLDKAKAETNMKVHLVSSGMFPDASTLLNAQSDPGAVVEDLIQGIKSDCLTFQEALPVTPPPTTSNPGETDPGETGEGAIKTQGITNFNEVLEHLSVCSRKVTLTDYKILTTQDGEQNVAIKALNSHFIASRLMNLLSTLESFAIDAGYYVKNDTIFEAPNGNPPTGQPATKTTSQMQDFLDQDIAELRFLLKEQLAKCQAGQFENCKAVDIAGYDSADDYQAIITDLKSYHSFIPARSKFDLPNTCNTLKDARGTRDFSSSMAYTIYYQRDLARAYQVYCLPVDEANAVELIGTPEDSRPEGTSFYEYIQLKSPQNLARATTHAAALNGGAFDQVSGSVEQATRYDRVRINPIDLTLEPEDLTYTFTVGEIKPVSETARTVYTQMPKLADDTSVKAIPLGTALGCNNNHATAMVNLEGTGLYFDPLMSERGAWFYSAFGELGEAPKVMVTKQSISIDSGFSEDCVQLRPADFRIKLALPVDVTVLDTPGLYANEVAFNHNPTQQFYLSGKPDELYQFHVNDDYAIFIDGFQIGSTNWWHAPLPFKARQGQTLNLIASNRAGSCALSTLYALLVDDDENIIGSHMLYEATEHTDRGIRYDYVPCNNGVINNPGPYLQFNFILDYPDVAAE